MSASQSGFGRRPTAPVDQPGMVRLKRGSFVVIVSLLGLSALWSVGATGFIMFRDDLSARLIARQVESQYAYEERIASLRAHVDRLASRQMLDQDSVEARVAELMSRQAQLETRSALVATLAQNFNVDANASTQQRKTMPGPSAAAPAEAAPAAPALPSSTTSFAPLAPRPLPVFEPTRSDARPASVPAGDESAPLKRRVSTLGQSLAAMERQQIAALGRIEAQSRSRVQRLRSVMSEIGVDPDRVAPTPPAAPAAEAPGAMGGPLVPVTAADAANFEATLARTKSILQTAQRLSSATRSLPIRNPLAFAADVTSGFGVRNDPFTRGYAMHTGVDFRAETGAPARATGAGVVTKAEYSGGYGNMVEIDHGHGLATRYAHLSAITVTEGQRVDAGAIIGRVGSTGRSTGSHLHYETRVAGDPTDPTRFLKVGGRYRDLF